MEANVSKLPKENFLQYLDRLLELKDKNEIDLDKSEIYELVFQNSLSSCEARKRLYLWRDIKKKAESEGIDINGAYKMNKENISNELNKNTTENKADNNINNILDSIRELEEKKIELELERKKLQTEKVEYNKNLREQARIELYLQKLEECISKLNPLELPKIEIKKTENNKVAIVNISDAHVGKEGKVLGLKGEILNEYNFQVFKQRMCKLFEEVLRVIEKENLENIILIAEGDMVDGILRNSQLQSLEYGIIDSVIEYSDFMTLWINKLSEYVYIDYHSAYGNHAGLRLLNAKSAKDFPNENVEKIIDKFLEIRLKDNSNVTIHNNQLPHAYFNVFGLNILATHGEEKNLVQTLKDFRIMYNEEIHMILTGHLHSNSSQDVSVGSLGNCEVIRVPSICGIDDFSMTLHKTSRASSKILIIEEGIGKTIEYSIYLN